MPHCFGREVVVVIVVVIAVVVVVVVVAVTDSDWKRFRRSGSTAPEQTVLTSGG